MTTTRQKTTAAGRASEADGLAPEAAVRRGKRQQPSSAPRQLPVTLLSGFLGAGKTTLLKHILKNKQGLRCAVLVNDMSEINIDAGLVKTGGLIQTQERLVEMQNGCICCTLRDDLLQEVSSLAKEGKFDYLVIESTGISEPQQVAETFELPPSEGAEPLKKLARLDTCVTVVDAASLLLNMASIETVADREGEDAAGGERNLADLLLDQIEFADVILLNKIDLVEKEERRTLEAFLRRLNPAACVLPTNNSQCDLSEVMGTGRFDIEKAAQGAGWLQSLKEPHTPETEEYGIGSFVYRARRPFHPERLWQLLGQYWAVQQVESLGEEEEEEEGKEADDEKGEGEEKADRKEEEEEEEEEGEEGGACVLSTDSGDETATAALDQGSGPGLAIVAERISSQEAAARQAALSARFGRVLRSKGFLWLAGRNEMSGEWSQAGAVLRISAGGPWFAAIPEEVWPDVDPAKVREDFDELVGDRRQELVFIGIGIKRKALTAALDACLCTEEEEAADPGQAGFVSWPGVEVVEVEVETEDDSSDGEEEEGEESGEESEEEAEEESEESEEEEAPAARKGREAGGGRSGSKRRQGAQPKAAARAAGRRGAAGSARKKARHS